MTRRVNVNFSDQAYRTLEDVAAMRGLTMSDTLRQAIALFSWYVETKRQGGRVLVERPDGAVRELISF